MHVVRQLALHVCGHQVKRSSMSAGRVCWHPLKRNSNLDTPVAINEEARRYGLESPHESAIMYARLNMDVVVGGFEKRDFDFVPGVARSMSIDLRLCKLGDDVGGRPFRPGESFLRQQLAQLCFRHFVSQYGVKLVIPENADEPIC